MSKPNVNKPEPQPSIDTKQPIVWGLVVGDMIMRSTIGAERYGTPLRAYNGRDSLIDAYQEALDLAVYLRQAIYERDNPIDNPTTS